MASDEGTTRVARLHDILRADVLRGVLLPGQPLRLAALSKTHDVSMSVVREALARLAEGNLAVLTPNHGYRVVEVSLEDLISITELRVMLEADALRRSIAHGDVAWEARVVASHHVLERAALHQGGSPGSTQEWSEAHADFHAALIAACNNGRMLAITSQLRDGAEIYRQLSDGNLHGGERDIAGEHREIMELATARDPRAVEALQRHLQRTTDELIASGTFGKLYG